MWGPVIARPPTCSGSWSTMPSTSTPSFYASQVNASAWSALEAAVVLLLWPDSAREQAKKPRALGGLSVHDPYQLADLAPAAALIQLRSRCTTIRVQGREGHNRETITTSQMVSPLQPSWRQHTAKRDPTLGWEDGPRSQQGWVWRHSAGPHLQPPPSRHVTSSVTSSERMAD